MPCSLWHQFCGRVYNVDVFHSFLIAGHVQLLSTSCNSTWSTSKHPDLNETLEIAALNWMISISNGSSMNFDRLIHPQLFTISRELVLMPRCEHKWEESLCTAQWRPHPWGSGWKHAPCLKQSGTGNSQPVNKTDVHFEKYAALKMHFL